MKTFRTALGATVLFVLGSVPQLARAQYEFCVMAYTDFAVNTTEGEVEAWAWVEDYFSGGYCGESAYYQWGYWEHTYFASASIESPTQNSAYDEDSMANIPYGGGWADASTSLSMEGDPGWFHIDWCVNIWCTIGDLFFGEVLDLL
jgi:hypothetical protein